MVRLTVREHIFAHELLVLIYKNEEPNDKAYKCMLTSIVFLYKAKDKRPDWDNTSFHTSRLIEKWILESYNIRKNRTKIKNLKLKKTKWWDASKPLTDKMINDGWEYGQYLNDDQMTLKSKQSRNRIWICKRGCPDKMIDPKLLDEYVA